MAPHSAPVQRAHAVLLALAWLGPLTRIQMQQLCLKHQSQKTMQRLLRALERHDPPLIRKDVRATYDAAHRVTRPQPALWFLTDAGRQTIARDPRYPRRVQRDHYPAKVHGPRGPHLRAHDLLTTATVVAILRMAMSQALTGVFVTCETRLDWQQPAPLLDALLLLHHHGQLASPDQIPWTRDPATGDEQIVCFALESDRGTEGDAMIAAKARAYLAVFTDPTWPERWASTFPVTHPRVVWNVSSAARLHAIDQLWRQVWSQGWWALTTPDLLATGMVIWSLPGMQRTEPLFGPTLAALRNPAESMLGWEHSDTGDPGVQREDRWKKYWL